ncbi:L,D-transpeptidase Cds6 family protein [Desulfurispira natronophila]|uniref:Murein L,D-transpeptidase YafK n=1 Tax=Desulfurispira natronophila TaxID=682562 RepID=A0A7W8DH68_9BACT|nr:L,D-transpeptidase family protein [Desulfurispira natronophila]MBB5021978.1 murein L,D-transpeptidase YafK [Desulfurispira natronophila]
MLTQYYHSLRWTLPILFAVIILPIQSNAGAISAAYFYQHALMQYGENNYTTARTYIHTAVEREESFKYYYLAGLVDLRLKNYPSAIANLERALQIIPSDTNPHNARYNLAFAYWKEGNHEQAKGLISGCNTKESQLLLGYISFEKGLQLILSTHHTVPATKQDLAQELLTTFQSNRNEINFIDDTPIVDLPDFSDDVLPGHVLQIPDGQVFIWTSKSKEATYIVQRQGDSYQVLEAYHSSTGKVPGEKQVRGDEKTPTGIYFPVRKLTSQQMPQRYGAYAFPVNYPNSLDRYLGRTGDGIWLHGINENDNGQIPYNSEGCVVLSNEGIFGVSRHVELRVTPIIMAEDFYYMDRDELNSKREKLLSLLNQWVDDWESLDHEAYMSHYSQDFRSGRHDYTSWDRDKARINSHKSWIEVELDNISLFRYPDLESNKRIMMARFHQTYRSSNYNSQSMKELYFIYEDDGQWRILTEVTP